MLRDSAKPAPMTLRYAKVRADRLLALLIHDPFLLPKRFRSKKRMDARPALR